MACLQPISFNAAEVLRLADHIPTNASEPELVAMATDATEDYFKRDHVLTL